MHTLHLFLHNFDKWVPMKPRHFWTFGIFISFVLLSIIAFPFQTFTPYGNTTYVWKYCSHWLSRGPRSLHFFESVPFPFSLILISHRCPVRPLNTHLYFHFSWFGMLPGLFDRDHNRFPALSESWAHRWWMCVHSAAEYDSTIMMDGGWKSKERTTVYRAAVHLHPSPVNAALAAPGAPRRFVDIPMNPGWFIMWSRGVRAPCVRCTQLHLNFLFIFGCCSCQSLHISSSFPCFPSALAHRRSVSSFPCWFFNCPLLLQFLFDTLKTRKCIKLAVASWIWD